jgi:hypothetical protein
MKNITEKEMLKKAKELEPYENKWVLRDRLSLPLRRFADQSPQWGGCLARASRGEEFHLYSLQVIKDLSGLDPSSLTTRVISRERIAGRPATDRDARP